MSLSAREALKEEISGGTDSRPTVVECHSRLDDGRQRGWCRTIGFLGSNSGGTINGVHEVFDVWTEIG